MKKIIFFLTFFFVSFCLSALDKSAIQKDTFKVMGNCGMCEKRIEIAANGVKGVIKADWDADKGVMILHFDPSVTNVGVVQKAIAAVGNDTETVRADDKVYAELPGCCQYERKNK